MTPMPERSVTGRSRISRGTQPIISAVLSAAGCCAGATSANSSQAAHSTTHANHAQVWRQRGLDGADCMSGFRDLHAAQVEAEIQPARGDVWLSHAQANRITPGALRCPHVAPEAPGIVGGLA